MCGTARWRLASLVGICSVIWEGAGDGFAPQWQSIGFKYSSCFLWAGSWVLKCMQLPELYPSMLWRISEAVGKMREMLDLYLLYGPFVSGFGAFEDRTGPEVEVIHFSRTNATEETCMTIFEADITGIDFSICFIFGQPQRGQSAGSECSRSTVDGELAISAARIWPKSYICSCAVRSRSNDP